MLSLRAKLAILGLFCALSAAVTWPQALHLSSQVVDHPDPYFSVWRLGWVAHALATSPGHLFDANIFYPEPGTFAFSDAGLLPATVLAPLFWIGLPPVLVYNIALLGALTLSGFFTALLARELTGHTGAAIVAGMVYAFAPYRMEQYIHLEMEMVFWIPLALLSLHRLVAMPSLGRAALFGLTLAAQVLSGLYGALYFFVCLAAVIPAEILLTAPRQALRKAGMVAVAAIVGGLVVLPYALIYARASTVVGDRGTSEIAHYGAKPRHYLASTPTNRWLGWTSAKYGGEELNLSPGVVGAGLATLGLVAAIRRRQRTPWVYVVLLALSLEAARGFDGVLYPLLYAYVPPLRGLRVPSRFDLYVNLAVGVIAAYGLAFLATRLRDATRPWLTTAVVVLMVLEYSTAPTLATAPSSRLDRWLATQPPGVVVQLPLPAADNFWPSDESKQMFQAMAHWMPMLNGYSGYMPPSYFEMLRVMERFPDPSAIDYLNARGVTYIVVRGSRYAPEVWRTLRPALENSETLRVKVGFEEELVLTMTK